LVALTPGRDLHAGWTDYEHAWHVHPRNRRQRGYHGSGRIYNNWLLDGADRSQNISSAGRFFSRTSDALQEFKVMSADMSAE